MESVPAAMPVIIQVCHWDHQCLQRCQPSQRLPKRKEEGRSYTPQPARLPDAASTSTASSSRRETSPSNIRQQKINDDWLLTFHITRGLYLINMPKAIIRACCYPAPPPPRRRRCSNNQYTGGGSPPACMLLLLLSYDVHIRMEDRVQSSVPRWFLIRLLLLLLW